MLPLLASVIGLAVLVLFEFGVLLAMRRRLDRLSCQLDGGSKECRTNEERLAAELGKIQHALDELENSPRAALPPGRSMNLTRRNQVLRMHFRGDSPSRIASALQISRGEVDLLLKVHRTLIPCTSSPRPATRAPRSAMGGAGFSGPTVGSFTAESGVGTPTAADASPASPSGAEWAAARLRS